MVAALSCINAPQHKRHQEQVGIQGKDHPQPHQQAQFRQGTHLGTGHGQKRQGGAGGGNEQPLAGVGNCQTDGLIS